MENQNNKSNNRNLIYSIIFFILANITLLWNPLTKAKEFIFSLPSSIKSKLLFSSLFPAFEQIIGSVIILVIVFLLCSLYFGIQFMRKEPNDKKLLKIIPKNLPGFFAVLLAIVCLIYLKMIVVEFFVIF